MADETAPPAPRKRAAPRKPAGAKAGAAPRAVRKSGTNSSRKDPSMTQTSSSTPTLEPSATATGASARRSEAKSRFAAAVSEAKAGAAALKAEASERAGLYREQAQARSKDWAAEAKAYGEEAKVKGKDLATQGKSKVSEGLTALGQTIADSAHVVDEKLGAKYGDYARTASRSLQETAAKLEAKSIDDLAEDGRALVRKSPGAAVGIAAVFGFLLSRLFTGSRR